jgi:DNA-binding protein H-NS
MIVEQMMSQPSLSALRQQVAALEAEIAQRTEEAKHTLRAEFDAKLADAGLKITDLYTEFAKPGLVRAKALKVTQSVDPKYRDPKTGATWSGRGRAPQWVEAILEERKLSIQAFKVTGEFRV